VAKQEHLDIIRQGVDSWNSWREEFPNIKPDLSGANLKNVHLKWVNFSRTNLSNIQISEAYLLAGDLSGANLQKADLLGAILVSADLQNANLSEANLSGAHLRGANFYGANLRKADLGGADLYQAKLKGVSLDQADVGWTRFGDVDLSNVKGLDTLIHEGPSSIGIDTIIRSHGEIPEIFLRKAGVPESIIEAIPSLVGSLKPIDYYSCFISYSNKDQEFAERLYVDLQAKGVRCWYAPEDMKTGDVIRTRIDEAIRVHDKLLLVLSQHSVESSWVEKEVETAFEKERQQKRHVLFPVRLDDVVMQTSTSWAADIRRMRHITDFTDWKDHDAYQKAFARLLRDLKAET